MQSHLRPNLTQSGEHFSAPGPIGNASSSALSYPYFRRAVELISNFLAQTLKDKGVTTTFDSTLIDGMNMLRSYLMSLAV
jgi:hypothetical protein